VKHGVVRAAWIPGRAEPEHRSEMVTQWICGEPLEVREEQEDGWLRVRGPGDYLCWVGEGGVRRTDRAELSDWLEAATARSMGLRVEQARRRGGPLFLPWGARLVPLGDGRVRCPDGTDVRPEPLDGVVLEEERRHRFPAEGPAVVETALGWLGAPYAWGGRILEGTDCSGFVQAVLAMHGVEIPRDSGPQMDAGPGVGGQAHEESDAEPGPATGPDGSAEPAGDPGRRPGDLLFFGDDPDAVDHVALVLEGSRIVHAAASNGAVARDDLSGDAPLARRLRDRLVGHTRPLAAPGEG